MLAEWFTLAVYPVAFTQYFAAMVPQIGPIGQMALKAVFIGIIILTNIYGVKLAGKFNDVLTLLKLGPLFLLICIGGAFILLKPSIALPHFQPFFTGNASNAGQALILIFWAYAGFELSSLPADEIQQPRKTLPKALFIGMLIVAAFYIITNLVVMGVLDQQTLASSTAPLSIAAERVLDFSPSLSLLGGLVLVAGAMFSILGADESATIGTSRLAFAMSIDGMLPRVFSRLEHSYRTPYVSIIILCLTALVASVTNSISALINSSVFLLSFAYLATSISAMILERRHSKKPHSYFARLIVPILGMIFSVVLMTQVTQQQIVISLILFAVGIPMYVFSPKEELIGLKRQFLSRDERLQRAYRQGEVFLANVTRHLQTSIYRKRHVPRAWKVDEN